MVVDDNSSRILDRMAIESKAAGEKALSSRMMP
jgi:hypothetical protein